LSPWAYLNWLKNWQYVHCKHKVFTFFVNCLKSTKVYSYTKKQKLKTMKGISLCLIVCIKRGTTFGPAATELSIISFVTYYLHVWKDCEFIKKHYNTVILWNLKSIDFTKITPAHRHSTNLIDNSKIYSICFIMYEAALHPLTLMRKHWILWLTIQ
jgi:hypothetical protein